MLFLLGVYTRNRNFRLFLSSKLGKTSYLRLARENKFKVTKCVLIFNPWGACAARVCSNRSVCVCQSVTVHRSFKPATDDTHRFLLGFSWILTRGFSKKTSRSKVIAWKSQYANELEPNASRFSHFRDQRRTATT